MSTKLGFDKEKNGSQDVKPFKTYVMGKRSEEILYLTCITHLCFMLHYEPCIFISNLIKNTQESFIYYDN